MGTVQVETPSIDEDAVRDDRVGDRALPTNPPYRSEAEFA
jgi:hypothetical protein